MTQEGVAVMALEAGQSTLVQRWIGLPMDASGEQAFDQPGDAVADVVPHDFRSGRRSADLVQHAIGRVRNVGQRVEQGAVEVEGHGPDVEQPGLRERCGGEGQAVAVQPATARAISARIAAMVAP